MLTKGKAITVNTVIVKLFKKKNLTDPKLMSKRFTKLFFLFEWISE